MENQQQPQAPVMVARPWFRLASIRTEIPVAPAAPPPVAAPAAAPPAAAPAVPPPVAAPRPTQPVPTAPERPLFRLGSLLRAPAVVPPLPQEPIQSPAQLQTRAPTPPPTAPITPPPPPPSPRTPLATAATQDQQPPSQAQRSPVTPSPAVRAPSPPAPPSPPSPTVIRLTEPIPTPSTAVRQQQTSPPTPPPPPPQTTTTVSPPPPPPVTTLIRSPAPSPRLPSPPPLHPEPETKPVVTVVTAQPSLMQDPNSSPYKDKNNNNNGNGGKKKLEMTQLEGQPRGGVSPPLPSPTSTPKKPDPAVVAAAVPGKKKSGVTDDAESRMRVLTLAGENMGAYMNLGSGVQRGGAMKGQGRHLTQTQTAQIDEKVAFAVAPGSNGGDAATKDVKALTGASKWKAVPSAAKPMAALVNSNVQSVNNSIMFNSSCAQRSPGVHITLSSGSRRPSSYGLLGEYSNGNGGGAATTTGLGDDRARANQFTS